MNKTDLYKLVDNLPDTEIPTAAAFLSFVTHRAKQASMDDFLDSVPEEDEEITEAEEAEIRAAEEDIEENGTVSHEEAMRFLAS